MNARKRNQPKNEQHKGLSTRGKRAKLIKAKLMPLAKSGTKVYNKSIQENVYITAKGIKETAHHASRTMPSTMAALDARMQLRTARKSFTTTAGHSKQQRDMKLVELVVMKGTKNGRKTKVTVGKKASGKHLLYCITSK